MISKKISGTDCFIAEVYQTFKQLIIILLIFLQETGKQGNFQTLFMRPALPQCQIQTKILQAKKTTGWYPCKKKDGNSIWQNIANWIRQHIKKIIQHDQVGFIQGMQGQFNIHRFINVTHCINKNKGTEAWSLWCVHKNIWKNSAFTYGESS